MPGFKRKSYSRKGGRFAKRRRYSGGASSLKGFLRPSGIRGLLPSPSSYKTPGAKNGNHSTTWNVRQAGSWIPDRMRIPLKWTVDLVMSITSGVGTQASFIANSVFDPGGSSASTHPYGWDVFSLMYSRYRVYASAIEVESQVGPSGSVAQANLPYQVIIWPGKVTTSFVSDPDGARQQPYGKDIMVGNSNAQTTDKYLRNYMSTAKIFGVDQRAVQDDDLYGGTILSSNPGNAWYWNLMCGGFPTGTNSLLMRVTMIQYAELYSRVSLAST